MSQEKERQKPTSLDPGPRNLTGRRPESYRSVTGVGPTPQPGGRRTLQMMQTRMGRSHRPSSSPGSRVFRQSQSPGSTCAFLTHIPRPVRTVAALRAGRAPPSAGAASKRRVRGTWRQQVQASASLHSICLVAAGGGGCFICELLAASYDEVVSGAGGGSSWRLLGGGRPAFFVGSVKTISRIWSEGDFARASVPAAASPGWSRLTPGRPRFTASRVPPRDTWGFTQGGPTGEDQ